MNAAIVTAQTQSPPSLDNGAARVGLLPVNTGMTDFLSLMMDAQASAQQQLSQRADDTGPAVTPAMNVPSAYEQPAYPNATDGWQAPEVADATEPEPQADQPPAEPAAETMPADTASATPATATAGEAQPEQNAAAEAGVDETGAQDDATASVTSAAAATDRADDGTAPAADEEPADDAATGGQAQETKREHGQAKLPAGPELIVAIDRQAAGSQQSPAVAAAATNAAADKAARVDRVRTEGAAGGTTTAGTPAAVTATASQSGVQVVSGDRQQARRTGGAAATADPAAAPIVNSSSSTTATAMRAGDAMLTAAPANAGERSSAAASAGLERPVRASAPVSPFAELSGTAIQNLYRGGSRTGSESQAESGSGRDGAKQEARTAHGPQITLLDRRTVATSGTTTAAETPVMVLAARPETVRVAAANPATTTAVNSVAGTAATGSGIAVKAAAAGKPAATAKNAGGDNAGAGAGTAPTGGSTAAAAADKAAAPAVVNRTEFVQQLQEMARTVNVTLTEGKTEVSMQLRPDELGRVDLKLEVSGDTLNARVVTETAAAKAAIEEHLPELLEQFAAQGLEVGAFSVEVRQQPQPAEERQDAGGSGITQDAETDADVAATDARWYRHSDSRVEYIV